LFEIVDIDALGRIGKLFVNNKQMITPNLFPVIHPFKNVVPASDLKEIGAQCLFTNAYIMYQNELKREKIIKSGIHNHLQFDGLIATDSGAFQKYMYTNNQIEINAEIIEKFQEDIGSDFPVILDIPVQLDDTHEQAKEKVNTTLSRAKDNVRRRSNKSCHWVGPIQGGKFLDLLNKSVNEMNSLDFEIYAIGGIVKAFLEYRFDLTTDILLNVKKSIVPNKPIHMFGLGLPQYFSLAVACGCDLMDSAAYILFAKEGRYFTLSTGTEKLDELEEFPCHCPICCQYTPKEMKALGEDMRIELLAKHNLYLSFSELRTIRQAIREGNLWELIEQRVRSHPSLVKALHVVNNNKTFIEASEKAYKKSGRLYISSESISRPLIKRYDEKITSNYRIPKEAKFLILLPELDTRGANSPSILSWISQINNTQLIPRELLHVVFISDFYGVIPLELLDTFPLSQFESITAIDNNDDLHQNSVRKALKFLNVNIQHYEKCGVLIPEMFLNQFNEIKKFSSKNPIHKIFSLLQAKYASKISNFTNILYLLQYFRTDGMQ